MTEEEKVQEETPQEEPEQEKEESEDSSDLISRANQAADRLEAGNKELKELIAAQAKLHVQHKLSGKASAGIATKTKEEQEIEEARNFLEGTGLEDHAFPKDKK